MFYTLPYPMPPDVSGLTAHADVRVAPTREPSGPHPRRPSARRHRGPRWVEFSVAATALVVSVASLLVARHQAQVMDRQLAASVWPMLEDEFRNTTPDSGFVLTRTLHNSGVGLLRVRSFRLAFQGHAMANARELLAACCERTDAQRGIAGLIGGYVNGRVIGAGTKATYFQLVHDSTRHAQDTVYHTLDRVMSAGDIWVRVCYCSVLDECWIRRPEQDEPQPVQSCAEERKAPQYR